jgi:hypothetical protein
LLPCTSVLQPTLVHLYQTSSLLPGSLPIVASASLRLLYSLLYSGHINCLQNLSIILASCVWSFLWSGMIKVLIMSLSCIWMRLYKTHSCSLLTAQGTPDLCCCWCWYCCHHRYHHCHPQWETSAAWSPLGQDELGSVKGPDCFLAYYSIVRLLSKFLFNFVLLAFKCQSLFQGAFQSIHLWFIYS